MTIPSETVTQIHAKVVAIGREPRILVVLRDTLLPRLISGELCMRDADRVIGRAT